MSTEYHILLLNLFENYNVKDIYDFKNILNVFNFVILKKLSF